MSSWVDPFLAVALPAAIAHCRPLVIEAPVSAQLHSNVAKFQDNLCVRNPLLRPTEVHAELEARPPTCATDELLFFSGGVDSSHALQTLGEKPTHLLYVNGFDSHPEYPDLTEQVWQVTARAAGEFGFPIIRVDTNVREFTVPMGDWGSLFHGPTKAAVALALSPNFRRCWIAGEKSPETTIDSSRLDLDPLWSTEYLDIRHVGFEKSRFEKLREITTDPRVCRYLRVCWENRGGLYNCGRCSKCVRNMAVLRALGRLEMVETFRDPLDLRIIRDKLRFGQDFHPSIQEILAHLGCTGRDPELTAALTHCLARNRRLDGSERVYRRISDAARMPERIARAAWRRLKQAIHGTGLG